MKKGLIILVIVLLIPVILLSILLGSSENETKSEEYKTSLNRVYELEKIYLNNIDAITVALNDKDNSSLDIQDSLNNSKDKSLEFMRELSGLESKFKKKSDEKEMTYQLGLAYNALRTACENGIKYIDSAEYSYLDGYKDDMGVSGQCYGMYKELKEKIGKVEK